MFKIGDKIVYPMHGAGEIVGIEEREILGNVHKYYIMRLPINDLKVMVPVKNAEEIGVRDISDIETMEKVLETLKSKVEISMPKNWNRRYRFNLDKIKSGNLTEIADVVRSLENLDREKSLSTGERKILIEAKQIIVSEMVLVFEKNVEEVTKLIDDAIFG